MSAAVRWTRAAPEERAAFVRKPVACKCSAMSLLSERLDYTATCSPNLDLKSQKSDLRLLSSSLSDIATADTVSSHAMADDGVDSRLDSTSTSDALTVDSLPSTPAVSTRSPGSPGSPRGVDPCLAALSHGLPELSRRPDPSVFHFTESSASILTEYSVTASGVGLAPTPAVLVVCYPHILHTFRLPRNEGLSRRLNLQAFTELHVSAVVDVNVNANPRQLEVAYSLGRHTVRLRYEADTPTDCSLIVAHIRYLKRLLMESPFA